MTMKLLPLIIGVVLLSGCAATPSPMTKAASTVLVPLTVAPQKSSYALGLLHIKTLREGQYRLDRQAYEQGLRDAMDGRVIDVALSETNAQADWQALADLSYAQVKAASIAAGKAYLEHNKNQKGVITLGSGVQYQVLSEGKGAHKPALDDTVGIVYKISGIDGTVKVDNNVAGKPQKMYEMPMQKFFSKGWQEALQLMTKGSKWRLFIPGELAFGERGLSEKGILPNETLVIDTQLVSIISPPAE